MTTLKVRLNPRTTLGTPLQADTIWGHFVVYYGYRYGQDGLKNLLERFETDPPFLVSDGFPSGYLPRPRLSLPGKKIDDLAEIVGQRFDDVDPKLVVIQALNHFRKCPFIASELLESHIDSLSMEKILSFILSEVLQPLEEIDPRKLDESIREYVLFDKLVYDPELWRPDIKLKSSMSIKNRVNRLRGSGSKIWGQSELYWPEGFDLYLKILDEDFEEIIKELLEDFELSGYGKKKSTGKGALVVSEIEKINFPEPEQPNGFISLSSFVPTEDDPNEGNYGIRIKRGKIGGWFPREISPFKRPALMLETGSTFQTDQPRAYYGSLLDNIHFDPAIRHYAYCFPLHVRISNGGQPS